MIVNLALTVWIMKVMNFSLVSTAGSQPERPRLQARACGSDEENVSRSVSVWISEA